MSENQEPKVEIETLSDDDLESVSGGYDSDSELTPLAAENTATGTCDSRGSGTCKNSGTGTCLG